MIVFGGDVVRTVADCGFLVRRLVLIGSVVCMADMIDGWFQSNEYFGFDNWLGQLGHVGFVYWHECSHYAEYNFVR